MNQPSSTPDASQSPAESGIRLSRRFGDTLATGVVTGCSTDIHLQLEAPFRIKVSSNHIPGFSLKVKQWMHDSALTSFGEKEVARLFEVALALGDAARANRPQLFEAFADWDREALPLRQSIDAARENLSRVKRERRDAVRDGGTHDPGWQHAVLKPAKAQLAQAEARLDSAEEDLETKIAGMLGFNGRLPGCVSWREVRQLLT